MKRLGVGWWILVAVVAGLWLTKPGDEDVEAGVRDFVMGQITAARALDPEDPLRRLIPIGCTADAETCYRIARNMMRVSREDMKLVVMVRMLGPAGQRSCIGAAKTLFCPDFLRA